MDIKDREAGRALVQRRQRLGEVGDDVGGVFDAGGEAYQPRADS